MPTPYCSRSSSVFQTFSGTTIAGPTATLCSGRLVPDEPWRIVAKLLRLLVEWNAHVGLLEVAGCGDASGEWRRNRERRTALVNAQNPILRIRRAMGVAGESNWRM